MILNLIKNMFLPSLEGTKAHVSALDTAISKRGETTKTEVYMLFGFKVLKWLFMVFIVLGVLFGWIDVWSLIKVLTASKIL